MSDELLSRVQAHCSHEWQYTAGLGKQCARCALLWETWAEQRIAALELALQAQVNVSISVKAEDQNEIATDTRAIIWTLLPPQTQDTCRHCDGTGVEPFGDSGTICAAICILCKVRYDSGDIIALAEQQPNAILPCGHGMSNIRLFYGC